MTTLEDMYVGFSSEEHRPQGLLGTAPQKKLLVSLRGAEGSLVGGDTTIHSFIHSDIQTFRLWLSGPHSAVNGSLKSLGLSRIQ